MSSFATHLQENASIYRSLYIYPSGNFPVISNPITDGITTALFSTKLDPETDKWVNERLQAASEFCDGVEAFVEVTGRKRKSDGEARGREDEVQDEGMSVDDDGDANGVERNGSIAHVAGYPDLVRLTSKLKEEDFTGKAHDADGNIVETDTEGGKFDAHPLSLPQTLTPFP